MKANPTTSWSAGNITLEIVKAVTPTIVVSVWGYFFLTPLKENIAKVSPSEIIVIVIVLSFSAIIDIAISVRRGILKYDAVGFERCPGVSS